MDNLHMSHSQVKNESSPVKWGDILETSENDGKNKDNHARLSGWDSMTSIDPPVEDILDADDDVIVSMVGIRAATKTSLAPSILKTAPPVVTKLDPDRLQEEVSFTSHLLSMWYLVVIVLSPILLLPIMYNVDKKYQKEAKCGYIIAVMGVYWTTECLPIAVTSLLPVVFLPALGVLPAKKTSAAYFNDTSMLFVGGLLVATAIEVWDVHKRIALLVLRIVGAEPRCLLLGITLVTWFLSLWISNTATAAMMMTIVHALLEQFKDITDVHRVAASSNNIETGSQTPPRQLTDHDLEDREKQKKKAVREFMGLGKALSLTVAYAANIGGTGSLTGTGPNLVFVAAAEKAFMDVDLKSPVGFSTWLIYGLPLSLILVIVMWLWMITIYLGTFNGSGGSRDSVASNERIQKIDKTITDEYEKLGPLTYAQGSVMVSFGALILTWVTRDLGEFGGWKFWFPKGYVSDSTPSILFGVLMFVLPSTFPSSANNRFDSWVTYQRISPLLEWSDVQRNMPWSIYLLLGGGYALAEAATVSGLSKWIGNQLLVFGDLNHWVVLLIVCYITTFLTEVTSNTAIATLLMPILLQMAISLQMNPLFLMFPAAITTSFAFMLPVGTPPNAIVFSHGIVRVVDMMMSGLFLNVVSVPILLLATATWGNAYFNFDVMPPEFARNVTKSK